ncbi:MAG: hypothetical protein GY725_15925 [bacterium]|nr:hypothetical protein [bacterium]
MTHHLASRQRRKFIRRLGCGVAGAAGFVGLLELAGCSGEESSPNRTRTSPSQLPSSKLAASLAEHFHYLDFEEGVLEAFARDFESHYGKWRSDRSPKPFTRFLASTDFFQNGADESRKLAYVRLYDPYLSLCYNPFSA